MRGILRFAEVILICIAFVGCTFEIPKFENPFKLKTSTSSSKSKVEKKVDITTKEDTNTIPAWVKGNYFKEGYLSGVGISQNSVDSKIIQKKIALDRVRKDLSNLISSKIGTIFNDFKVYANIIEDFTYDNNIEKISYDIALRYLQKIEPSDTKRLEDGTFYVLLDVPLGVLKQIMTDSIEFLYYDDISSKEKFLEYEEKNTINYKIDNLKNLE